MYFLIAICVRPVAEYLVLELVELFDPIACA